MSMDLYSLKSILAFEGGENSLDDAVVTILQIIKFIFREEKPRTTQSFMEGKS